MSFLAAGCGKDTIEPPDPERDFVGQWIWEERERDDENVMHTERITITFYDPSAAAVLGGMTGAGFITSAETYAYKWIYMYLLDGAEDESKHHEEIGIFDADGTEVLFTPQEGEPRTYQYVIPTSSDVDMVLTDEDGVDWVFDRKESAW
jgi:hypothetical protein